MPLSYFPCPRLFRNGELSQSLQDPYLDEEEGVSRISMLLGVVTFVVVAMGAYNLAWRQPQLASLREIAQSKSAIIEIDATGKASKAIVPSTRAEITVEGSDLPQKAALQADPLIAAIQSELLNLGLYDGPADGIPGQTLREAIANWQRRNQLPITGAANAELLEKLAFERQIRAAQNFDIPPSASSEETASVQIITAPSAAPQAGQITASTNEATGVDLRQIQIGLADLGYRPGAIDGQWREQIAQAIREFEKDRGLPVTGKPSLGLMAELGDYVGQPSAQLQ